MSVVCWLQLLLLDHCLLPKTEHGLHVSLYRSIKRGKEQIALNNNRMEPKRPVGSCTREVQTKKTGIFSVEKLKEPPRQKRFAHSG